MVVLDAPGVSPIYFVPIAKSVVQSIRLRELERLGYSRSNTKLFMNTGAPGWA